MKGKPTWWNLALLILLASSHGVAGELGGDSPRAHGAGTFRAVGPRADATSQHPAWNYFYRALSLGSEHRSCRFHPTCSAFAHQAVRRWGWVGGWLRAWARMQMDHSPQGGYLFRRLASDGGWIYPDGVAQWEHR